MLKLVHKHPKAEATEFERVRKYINQLEGNLPSYETEKDGTVTVTISKKKYTLQPKP